MSNVLVEAENSLNIGTTRALNLAEGGQQGPLTDPKKWTSSATYVRQKLIAVLIEAPRFMQYMDNGEERIAMLKAIVELLPTSVTGLSSKLDVTFSESKVSNAGEMHHTMTQVVRTPSTPSFVLPEKEGKAIFNFFTQWITELLADPETGHPGLITKEKYISEGSPEFLPDAVSMSVLFFEPSKDLTRVTSAWLCANMQPKTSGDDAGERVIGEANATVEHTIEFTATTQIGKAVIDLAQKYLDDLNQKGFRPEALPAFYDKVSSDVEAGAESYKQKVEDVAKSL